MTDPVVLGPTEDVPGRDFASAGLIDHDRIILTEMLADVRRVLLQVAKGRRVVAPHQKLVWKVRGLTKRLLISDELRLRSHPRLCLVGFFGERHPEMDASPLEEANTAIVAAFVDHPGILSYSSMEIGAGRWANLVLHEDPADREYWRQNSLHAEAVRVLSPVHYLSVRIHNGELTAPVVASPAVVLTRTKYFDYSGLSPWRAERVLS